MSIISDSIQAKCLTFGDRIIKLNDYLLSQAAVEHENYKKELRQRKPGQKTSSILHQPSSIPLHLQSVAALCNQLLRSGTKHDGSQRQLTSKEQSALTVLGIPIPPNGLLECEVMNSGKMLLLD